MEENGTMKELATAVVKAAPVLGEALLGPWGRIAALVVASEFGADVENEADMLDKVLSHPQSEEKLKSVESKTQLSFKDNAK